MKYAESKNYFWNKNCHFILFIPNLWMISIILNKYTSKNILLNYNYCMMKIINDNKISEYILVHFTRGGGCDSSNLLLSMSVYNTKHWLIQRYCRIKVFRQRFCTLSFIAALLSKRLILNAYGYMMKTKTKTCANHVHTSIQTIRTTPIKSFEWSIVAFSQIEYYAASL